MSAGENVKHTGVLARDIRGATTVEFGLVGATLVLALMGIVEFGNAYWQWNRATKAVQLGARLAAVSNPVSSDLKTWDGTSASIAPGDDMPYFKRVCSGSSASCTGGSYDAVAMRTLVYGRGNAACPTVTQVYPGMCSLYRSIAPQNVVVEYEHTGLGYAGRPGGVVPTITVRLTGLPYNFLILNGLLNFAPITMNGLSATITGEDLSGA